MAMTNEEISQEFENLFGDSEEEQPEETPEEETPEENEDEKTDDESDDEEPPEDKASDDSSEDEEPPEDPSPEDKKKAKQNYAFAQQRQQIKAQETFIKNLGKLIGMDNAKPDEIQNKVQEVLLQKQSQEQNIPVEILQRLQNAEAIIQENQEIKRQNEVQSSFADLVEKHGLSQEDVSEFTQHLINEGKNPLDNPNVDIHAEYLKLHFDDMLKSAVADAVKKEQQRKDKVKDHGSEKVPGGGGTPDDKKINSVKELDDLFGGMDL